MNGAPLTEDDVLNVEQMLSARTGEVPQDILSTLLTFHPAYLANPALELVDGFTQHYKGDGSGPARGTHFSISYPMSWKRDDRERVPGQVVTFVEADGHRFASLNVIIRAVDGDALAGIATHGGPDRWLEAISKEHEFFTSALQADGLTNIRNIDSGMPTVAGRRAVWSENTGNFSRDGFLVQLHLMSIIVLDGTRNSIALTFGTGAPPNATLTADNAFARSAKVFQLMLASLRINDDADTAPQVATTEQHRPPTAAESSPSGTQAATRNRNVADRNVTDPLLKFAGQMDTRVVVGKIDTKASIFQRGDLHLTPVLWGKQDVFVIHPKSQTVPATLDFSEITKQARGRLTLHFRNALGGDATAVIKADNRVVEQIAVDGDQWKRVTVPFDHSSVVVEARATGWWNEHVVMTYSIDAETAKVAASKELSEVIKVSGQIVLTVREGRPFAPTDMLVYCLPHRLTVERYRVAARAARDIIATELRDPLLRGPGIAKLADQISEVLRTVDAGIEERIAGGIASVDDLVFFLGTGLSQEHLVLRSVSAFQDGRTPANFSEYASFANHGGVLLTTIGEAAISKTMTDREGKFALSVPARNREPVTVVALFNNRSHIMLWSVQVDLGSDKATSVRLSNANAKLDLSGSE